MEEGTMKGLKVCLALAMSCIASSAARAEISGDVVRVGVLNDISGIFQDTNGMGSVEAARMAAEDFNGGATEKQGERVCCGHQNKHGRRAGHPGEQVRDRGGAVHLCRTKCA